MHIDLERHGESGGNRGGEVSREKSGAALNSLFAAVFLTGIKLVVGLSTNSLGILSEATHSGLDLVAAGVTWFAVRYSGLPADKRHPYGHGKLENLSALIETLLLLITCAFIVREAVGRLFFHPEAVEVTWWSFGVMAVSILVDLSRSRMLMRMAKKHKSQALEADALHFATDVWSSSVVILGLGCVAGARLLLAPGSGWYDVLMRADAVAAVGVCAIVVRVSIQLGRRAVDALLDGGSEAVSEAIRTAVESLPGVRAVSQVRARHSGASAFVDLTVDIPRQTSFEQAHAIGARAEEAVRGVAPGADVVVHLEPVAGDDHDLFETVRAGAARHGLAVHGLQARQTRAGLHLEMHVEVPDGLSLADAHAMVTALERDLKALHRQPLSIASHIEPVGAASLAVAAPGGPADVPGRPEDSGRSEEPGRSEESGRSDLTDESGQSGEVRKIVQALVNRVEGVSDCHGLVVYRLEGGYSVCFHCRMDPAASIGQAHAMSAHLEGLVRGAIPDVGRVVIHVEPRIGEG